MRIDVTSLDPSSKLAARIAAALAKEPWRRPVNTGTAGRSTKLTSSSLMAERWGNEEALQRAVVEMVARECRPGVLVFHVPNGGQRVKAEAGRLKAMGTRAGIPDLVVLIDGRAYGLELKTARGRQNPAQKTMAETWRRAGCDYEIARTVTEARAVLVRWGAIAAG
jgi:hypothetical protein